MDYETFAVLARSWGLVFLVALFLGAVAFALWPGNRKRFQDASQIPLRDEQDEEGHHG